MEIEFYIQTEGKKFNFTMMSMKKNMDGLCIFNVYTYQKNENCIEYLRTVNKRYRMYELVFRTLNVFCYHIFLCICNSFEYFFPSQKHFPV